MYLISFPMRAKLSTVWFFLAAYCSSIVHRKITHNKKDSFPALMLADEEAMHAIWLMTYLLLGWQLKIPVDIMFMIWAYINTCEWFDYIHYHHENIPIVGLFSGIIQMIQDNTVEIVTFKNYMEITLVPVSAFAWLQGWCAPVLVIILVQALRIKFMGSNFTRRVMYGADAWLKKIMPAMFYSVFVRPAKSFLSGMAGVKEALENEKTAPTSD